MINEPEAPNGNRKCKTRVLTIRSQNFDSISPSAKLQVS